MTRLVKRLYCRYVFAEVAQIAVRIVFKYIYVILLSQLKHLLALFKAHSLTGRILEIRNKVDESCSLVLFKSGFKLFNVYSVIFHLNAYKLSIIGTECVQRADERRCFADNYVTLVAYLLGDYFYRLLCARCDYYIFFVLIKHTFFLKVVLYPVTKGRISLRDRILKGVYGRGCKYFVCYVSDLFSGESLGSGIARCKADYLGICRKFEYLSYC